MPRYLRIQLKDERDVIAEKLYVFAKHPEYAQGKYFQVVELLKNAEEI